MDAETWMNANKALELGFCDEIMAAWYSPSETVSRSGKMHRGKRFGEIPNDSAKSPEKPYVVRAFNPDGVKKTPCQLCIKNW